MTRLTKQDEPFVWKAKQQLAFKIIVTAFTTAPIRRHFDLDREEIIETHASNCVSAEVLSQYYDEGVLHPMAYFSKKYTPAERDHTK